MHFLGRNTGERATSKCAHGLVRVLHSYSSRALHVLPYMPQDPPDWAFALAGCSTIVLLTCTCVAYSQYDRMREAAKRQQSDMHQLLCQINDQLFAALTGVMCQADPDLSAVIQVDGWKGPSESSAAHANIYYYVLPNLTPVMAPPSVPITERRDLLKRNVSHWEDTVQASELARSKQLHCRLQRACARRERLDAVR